ncbi:LisH [Musa troglodytarum]|uniref:LisH n=1 Tax=Musa troglodytarum TaxID=320322 RepID=A0A9E7GQW8_9LILI|nr:LisH [Musa troglodytarum]URE21083.1 LisH [Musa troglodytarum]
MEAVPGASADELAPGTSSAAGSEEAKVNGEGDDEALVARAQKLIGKIVDTQENPNPRLLHALASLLEAQESRYLQESASSPFNNVRASHTIGRLANLVQENDEFYEAISSKFLSESRYSTGVRAAAARLILSCSSSWMYPHVFDDDVLDNIKTWLMEENIDSNDDCIWKHVFGEDKPTESEMLTTYATGLLALALASPGPVVEDILTSGLSAKLMRYLRTRILGDANVGQKNFTYPAEVKHASVASYLRGRDENKLRSREVSDAPRLEGLKAGDEGSSDDSCVHRDCDRVTRQVCSDEYWGDALKSDITDSSTVVDGAYEMVEGNADLASNEWQDRNLLDGKLRYGERLLAARSTRDEDPDENMRDDSSRRKVIRGLQRSRTKGRISEGNSDSDRVLTSPSSGLRLGGSGRVSRDRNLLKNEDTRKVTDTKNNSIKLDCEGLDIGEDNDDRLLDCYIGSRDISEMVKKAIGAAEAEARAANAPAEAIKAAGDAAAELVKTAALEAWNNTKIEEEVILAASKAASSVVDAAIATEISRTANEVDENLTETKAMEVEGDEMPEDLSILDKEPLARLREKYCIQCLQILGEYVEAFGPILHEKGVDVCLALLQQSFKEEVLDNLSLLPEGIMERVCALPSDVVSKVIELALQLLVCPQDQARKNAAIFFAAAFVFRAVLDSFDAHDGLQKMLNLLHGAASVRSGGNSGTLGMPDAALRNDRSEILTASEKQIAYHTCVALRQYFRAHLLLLVESLRPNKSSRTVARNTSSARAAYKPLDISNESMDAVFLQIQRDRKIGPAFVRVRWSPVDRFLASNGHITMLELCQAPPVERYLHDLAQYALGVLHIVTFIPNSRKLIINATLSNNRVGMAVILDAANGAGFVDPEVGKKLSELIRDSGCQAGGTEQGRWQAELVQVAIELIAIVTNSGRASTLAATDAAAPTLRRIERAAIAAATPITYHSRELLLLIHEHLQRSGLTATAALLQKEADLTPLPSLGVPSPPLHQTSVQDTSSVQLQWPSGRASCGFSSDMKMSQRDEDTGLKRESTVMTSKKKTLTFSSSFSQGKSHLPSHSSSVVKSSVVNGHTAHEGLETPPPSACKSTADIEPPSKTPNLLPVKRKLNELKDLFSATPAKRLLTSDLASQTATNQMSTSGQRNHHLSNPNCLSPHAITTPRDRFSRGACGSLSGNNIDDIRQPNSYGASTAPVAQSGLPADQQPGNTERMTLDSLVVQYLKNQHRQCPAPITTLPPLSLLHPHVCPEPSRSLNAPANVTARLSTREFMKQYGGIHAHRRDRQFVYSRFRPFRTCRDDAALLTCITYLGDSSHIATGSHSGELKIFDSNSGNVLESQTCHQTPVTLVQSASCGGNQFVLSSGLYDVKLWDASSISTGPLHSFEGCKAARFSHSGTNFATLSSDTSRREVLLYDVQTYNVELRLPDSSSNHPGIVRGHAQSLIHFSPLDTLLLWNGILWDRRSSSAVHRFDQFTDYGGGGFHPAGNEIIINSEVWDLRKFKLLRTVPSLDQTVITFSGGGDVIYAILRRNLEDVMSAVNTRRVRHPLFPAFRTIDAVNYADIATVQVDRCVLDLAVDPADSFVGVIAMDDHDEMFSSARLYEVGRKRPTDDDSDPDDGGETDEDEENDESEADVDAILEAELDGDGDSDSDDMSNDEDEEDVDSGDELDEDGDFNLGGADFEGGRGLLEIMAEGDEEGDSDEGELVESLSSGEEGDFTF